MKADRDWQDPEDWGVVGWTVGVFACAALVAVFYVGSILLGVWVLRLMGVQP